MSKLQLYLQPSKTTYIYSWLYENVAHWDNTGKLYYLSKVDKRLFHKLYTDTKW